MTEAVIIWKPVTGFYMITASVMKELKVRFTVGAVENFQQV